MTSRQLLSILVILAAATVLGCAGAKLTPDEVSYQDFGEYPSNYQQLVMNWFSPKLIDPQSAIFYFAKPIKAKDAGKYGYKVRMEINAKNRYGGYTGRQLYHFMIRNGEIWQCDEMATGITNGLRR